ncbi:ABC transporter ATP-binding protein [Cupriavidus plantarum]|uniref:Carbohydrate ABC transporter ATP-binding protein (CUT1 family) n=1 Tax=Cupriavidus plantarum TaxID=942865 RepID=A0A316F8U9_9BURK|nr:ABC transporter ATP-binding protein [Cupriavidus plantarum]PWK33515.1 carbohydrate ABC transporter ATP-binding protein (CUT1 family) [Cupriavidus plantarum]
MAYLRLERLRQRFGDHDVLRGIDLEIERGEFIALLGASGCGKTTLLRLIAGLDRPAEGSIHIDGRDVTALDPAQRLLSMVFQSYALFPHLSVADNIVFGLRARRVERNEQARRLQHAADLLGLGTLLARKPGALSGGQKQRVALARAIVSQHPLCLMDEPLSNLDAQLRAEMRAELRKLQQQLGLTVVYVTHDQVEAMSMADRIVLMHQGQIAQLGTPAQLYDQPATPVVARFIGQPPMNLIRLPGASAWTGVRPEHIEIGGGHAAVVTRAEYHGADTLIEVMLHGQPLLVRHAGRVSMVPGTALSLRWSPDREHRFAIDPMTAPPLP